MEGNVLKYAVNARTFGFMNKAIDEWRANLNLIDKDDTTLLDYIELQITRSRGAALESTLRAYYNKVQRAGGKHRRELP